MAFVQDLKFRLLGEDTSASKSMTGVQSTAEKVTGKIGGAFSKLGGIIGGEFGEVLGRVGDGIDTVGEKGLKLGTSLKAGGAVITGLGVGLQQLGSANKQAEDQLAQALKTSGSSYEEYKDRIEKAIAAQQKFGHSDDDTQQALQKLTTAFQDPNKALKDMAVVADLAASKHISLADAADLVVRITAGKGAKTLSQYGIVMGQSKDKTHDAQVALEQLAAKVQGQASAAVDNFAGKVGVVRTQLGDWAADMANKVGPILTAAGPIIMIAGVAVDFLHGRQQAAALSAIAQATATEAATTATVEETGAMVGLDAAMDANPIGLVALGLGALAAIAGGLALSNTRDLTGATKAYGDALDRDNGLIKDNVKQTAAKALLDDGSLKAAKELGIAGSLLIAAATGNTAAQKELNKELDTRNATMKEQQKIVLDGKDHDQAAAKQVGVLAYNIGVLNNGYLDQSAALKSAKRNQDLYNGSLGKTLSISRDLDKTQSGAVTGRAAAEYGQHAQGGMINSPQVSWVGENGPEKVLLPGGSRVLPAGSQGGGGGGPAVHIHLEGNVYADKASLGQVVSDALIQFARMGGSKTQFKQAYGIS